MAEIRKKEVQDKYNLEKIKGADKRKTSNKKVVVKKEVKTVDSKKGLLVRFRIFWHGVKSEFHKVHWPSKENMFKYSIATIFFVVFCASFFYLIDIIFAFVRSLFN